MHKPVLQVDCADTEVGMWKTLSVIMSRTAKISSFLYNMIVLRVIEG
jgi:hypothetical protein